MSRFKEQGETRPKLDRLMLSQITIDESLILVVSFEEKEVKDTIWECDGKKSLRPDSINFIFLKRFWEIMKGDWMRLINEFHANGVLPRGCNASFIALIPKVKAPQSLEEYGPISLVGCMYKILAKLLANRLKRVMHVIIDQRQSAFLTNRYLTHSVLVANEVIDETRREKKKCLFFKVDY